MQPAMAGLNARDVEDAADALSVALRARKKGDHIGADAVLQQVPSDALAFAAVNFLFVAIEGFDEGFGEDVAFADILAQYGQGKYGQGKGVDDGRS